MTTYDFDWKHGMENRWMKRFGLLTRIYIEEDLPRQRVIIETEEQCENSIYLEFYRPDSDDITDIEKRCERIVEELVKPISSMDLKLIQPKLLGDKSPYFFTLFNTKDRAYIVEIYPYHFGNIGYLVSIVYGGNVVSITIKDRYGLDKELERIIPILEKEVFELE